MTCTRCGRSLDICGHPTGPDRCHRGTPPDGTLTISTTTSGGRHAEEISLSETFLRRYRIEAELGCGSFGTVFKALDLRLDRTVAVKFLVRIGEPEELERFLREGRLLASVRHPNVVEVYDFTAHEHNPYLVVEYLDGGTLQDRLAGGRRLPVEQSLSIAADCVHALEACHGAGVVHRDVKPANVLFTTTGFAKLGDLGIARLQDEVQRLTRTGALLGTPLYMAPEAARGEDSGPPADVHAVGAVMFRMLSGRHPFEANSVAEILKLISSAPATHLGKCVPGLGPDVTDLVMRCLEKDPARRPDCAALSARLQELRHGCARRAPRPALRQAAVSQAAPAASARERPSGWRTESVAALCLTFLAVGWLAGAHRSTDAVTRTESPIVRASRPGQAASRTSTPPPVLPLVVLSKPLPSATALLASRPNAGVGHQPARVSASVFAQQVSHGDGHAPGFEATTALRIPVEQLIRSGKARVEGSPSDLGRPPDAVDGNPDTLMRTPRVNPAFVRIVFNEPQLAGSAYVAVCSDEHLANVSVADTVEELVARTGSYRVVLKGLTGFVQDGRDRKARGRFPQPAKARVFQLDIAKLTGDDFVHIYEWQLFAP